MSRPKAKDFRALSVEELSSKREALIKELHGLRQKKSIGQLDKPHLFKAARRQVAQIMTIKNEKQNAKRK